MRIGLYQLSHLSEIILTELAPCKYVGCRASQGRSLHLSG